MSADRQIVPSGTRVARLKGYDLVTPDRTAKLLWISGEDPDKASFGFGLSLNIEIIGGKVSVTNLPATDPSTIFTRMPISEPAKADEVPRPDYYPTYTGLTPQQKWIYLSWLRHVSQPVDIGYVFVYYYGLERHLLLGDFDLAFDEILFLRKHHQNHSFLSYSGSALLHSCIFRKRLDRLEGLSQTAELAGLGSAELLMVYGLGYDFTVNSLIDVSQRISGINRRYLKSNEALFEEALSDCLQARYGDAYFPFASRWGLTDVPKRQDILFANISFPPEIRTPDLPSFLDYSPFVNEVRAVFAEAHERVKSHLKEERKRKA